ncbi:hypothetical protein L596_001519 [Steinernema carpocapsae]|uniref:Uncharacterized protein n=1 Tax=Steinernema carpocapsae TaxID=34508 RepID=A0A4U8UQG6_STECR|nr:hypothetical protein L596_001519 [Steinernema carpocapsae]
MRPLPGRSSTPFCHQRSLFHARHLEMHFAGPLQADQAEGPNPGKRLERLFEGAHRRRSLMRTGVAQSQASPGVPMETSDEAENCQKSSSTTPALISLKLIRSH